MLQQRLLLGLSLVIFLGLLSGVIWYGIDQGRHTFLAGQAPKGYDELPTPDPIRPTLRSSDPIRGSEDPQAVDVMFFCEYASSACRGQEAELRRLLQTRQVNMRVIWRDFINPGSHPAAIAALVAGHCAAEQAKFWEMHDLLIVAPALDMTTIKQAATQISLDQKTFTECLTNLKTLTTVANDTELARKDAHIKQGPVIFVGTKFTFSSFTPAEKILAAIRASAF